MKPLCRYVGGKQKTLDSILPFFPNLRLLRYFEPFVGAGAVALHLLEVNRPFETHLGDLCPETIMVLRAVRDEPLWLRRQLERLVHFFPPREGDNYKRVRELHNLQPSPETFLYLQATNFNGLWRVNQSGGMNTPEGSNKVKFPTLRDLTQAATLLEGVQLYHEHWRCSAERWDANSFVYADPPYHMSSHLQYTPEGWTTEDLEELVGMLEASPCSAAISNADTHFVLDTMSKWTRREVQTKQTVSCKERGAVTETLYTKEGVL